MVKKDDEKTISGDVENSLYEEYNQRTHALRMSKKKLVRSLVLWWLSMDEDEQKNIYHIDNKFSVERLIEKKLKFILDSPQGRKLLGQFFAETGEAPSKKKR